jgi:hypothetical protein
MTHPDPIAEPYTVDPLVVDIETVPLAASLDADYPEAERQPPANYKSEDAIARWRLSDRNAWEAGLAKTCSLNPRLGRVLCIGMGRVSGDITVQMANTEADEAFVLQTFWNEVADAGGDVVTWNGSWDLRFILMRSLHHGIRPTLDGWVISDWFRRYSVARHFDCKAVLLNWDVRVSGEGLDQWAKFFGVGGKLGGISGADVYPLYLGGQLIEIAEYCQQDVTATRAIYQRIAPVYL